MEKTKLIKYNSGQLQKVENKIALTNKLLENEFDYPKWWDDLDANWKRIFQDKLKLQVVINNLAQKVNKEIYELTKSQIEINNKTINTTLGYFASFKKIEFVPAEISDLEYLKVFNNLEELRFANGQIKSLKPLESLANLKLLDCSQTVVRSEEIEKFKVQHPHCEVLL